MQITGTPKKYRARTLTPGRRKIAIIGTAPTLRLAPWDDESWEIWAHASAGMLIPRVDLFIDVHPKHCLDETRKNGFKDYRAWLQTLRTPILTRERWADIPAAVAYPYEQVKTEWPWPIGSQAAALTAYALLHGVTDLGFWGVEYSHGDLEYREQRANTEFWAGIAVGAGVRVVIPASSGLCHEPRQDYAFQTHSVADYAARKAAFREHKALQLTARLEAGTLTPILTAADEAAARTRREDTNPSWAATARTQEANGELMPEAFKATERAHRTGVHETHPAFLQQFRAAVEDAAAAQPRSVAAASLGDI